MNFHTANPARMGREVPLLATRHACGVASPAAAASPFPPAARQGKSVMNAATVRITHIVWRDGRPRFEPGPAMRRLGYKGRDLKHPDGAWFTFEEAAAESERISAEAQLRATAKAAGQKIARIHAPAMGRTLGQLREALFALPEFKGSEIRDGKKLRKGLSPKTVDGYRKSANAIEKACARLAAKKNSSDFNLWEAPAAGWTPKLADMLLNEIEVHSGLPQARACRAFLSQLWTRLAAHEPGALENLWRKTEPLPTTEGRVRPWEPAEFFHMIAVADANGRPEMADSFVYGVVSGQRQTDRLTWLIEDVSATHITGRQSKTAKLVSVKMSGLFIARFTASRARRKLLKVQWPHLLIDETAGRPWDASGDHYRKVFAGLRAIAATAMASCASLRDQDLRDTNQTWLDRASVDGQAMALIAGHSPSGARQLQRKHYVAENQQKMDAAIDLLAAYMEKKTGGA
jgi:hypothetical protein